MARENMAFIECGTCSVPGHPRHVPLLNQYRVPPSGGIPTFEYHCTSCNGKVVLQIHKNPQTGETYAKQVRLTGSPDEFRPDPIRPNTQVQIPVAYTLGGAKSVQHVPAPPLKAPPAAYTLGGAGQRQRRLPPNHPMHPDQIRRRIQPVRWNQ
jgi:hypothetical protein